MLSGKNKRPLGYTIVEVMIVLAVSGLMFLVAANFINGKEEHTAFTEGTNNFASSIQNVIEQVTDGQYSDVPLNCQFSGSSTTFPLPQNINQVTQGTNSDCVFLGKLMYFSSLDSGTPTPSPNYQILSVAGGRVDLAGNAITDIANAFPAVAGTPNVSSPNLTTNQTIDQQLNVSNIIINGLPATTAVAIGFMQSQGSNSGVSGVLTTGPQTISLYYVSHPLNGSNLSNLHTAQSADLCLNDSQRYAVVDVGATNSNQLSVNVTVTQKGTPPC